MTSVTVRKAKKSDLTRLIALEEQSFSADRISRRSWQALLRSPSAIILIAQQQPPSLAGAAVLLIRRNSKIARLYSIAIAPAFRRGGLGRRLLEQALVAAAKSGRCEMRLESRADNSRAHRLFRTLGFAEFGQVMADYYQDGMGAIRFRRPIAHLPQSKLMKSL